MIFEVAERKLVSGFRIFGMRFVDPKMPFAIFSESVHANEFVLLPPPSDDDLSTNFSYQQPTRP